MGLGQLDSGHWHTALAEGGFKTESQDTDVMGYTKVL